MKNENKYLAWGVVPTNSETLKNINLKEIIHKFEFQLTNLSSLLDISEEEILKKAYLLQLVVSEVFQILYPLKH